MSGHNPFDNGCFQNCCGVLFGPLPPRFGYYLYTGFLLVIFNLFNLSRTCLKLDNIKLLFSDILLKVNLIIVKVLSETK